MGCFRGWAMGICMVALVFGGAGTGVSDSFLSADDIRSLKAFEFGGSLWLFGKSHREIVANRSFHHSRGDSFLSRNDVKMLAWPSPGRVPDTDLGASGQVKKAAPYHGAGDAFLSADDVKMLNGFSSGRMQAESR